MVLCPSARYALSALGEVQQEHAHGPSGPPYLYKSRLIESSSMIHRLEGVHLRTGWNDDCGTFGISALIVYGHGCGLEPVVIHLEIIVRVSPLWESGRTNHCPSNRGEFPDMVIFKLSYYPIFARLPNLSATT
jgi:hypothetical protein